MKPREALFYKMFRLVQTRKEYANGFTFMCGLKAMCIEYESDDYFTARAVIADLFGEQEALALDNAYIKSTR